ncbi:MAG: NAD-dependent epimerase/dehydratase family protein [Holosporales bacterium]|jgi:nucleoside-diphosphate-sugar epimerase|nr:NAD-dependent epimerase/dehydratase family protein [Holosporales bacterium]
MDLILVTGASGFVGSALCVSLKSKGRVFRGVARTCPAWAKNSTHAFAPLDLLSAPSQALKTILSGVTTIVHCAARAHIMRKTERDPERAFQALNADVTRRLLEEAIETKTVKRFVFVSSIVVNGQTTPKDAPFREQDQPSPESPYARSKWRAEQVVKEYATKIETVILRPPLIYGPEARGNFALLSKAVCARLPLPLASINNRRSFLFLENMVSALEICIDHPHATGETFLVSDTESLSTPCFVSTLAKGLGLPSLLWPCPVPILHVLGMLCRKQDSIRRLTESRVIDSRKIRETLQWNPPYTAAEGIEKTGRSYRAQKDCSM